VSIEIVPMTAAHIVQLMPYEKDMFGSESWSESAYREELADKRHRLYVAAVDSAGVLQAWAGVRVLSDAAEILTIGVIPTARKAGLGQRMLTTLLDEAKRRGAEEVFLDVRIDNDDAKRLYEREGFLPMGMRRGYYDNGRTDALTMSLRFEVAR
jgi:ribosomal-protein-alanine N-acetyltransferase